MSIVLTCPDCERSVELAEPPPGGKMLCPTCLTLLRVPVAGEAEEQPGGLYSTPQIKRCPKCNKESPAAAVLCIHCGFNFTTGKQTRQVVRVKAVDRQWWFGPVPFYFVTVNLIKSRSGETSVLVKHNLFFIPVSTTVVDLRDCSEIWTDYRAGFGVVGLTVTILLLLCCVFPGMVWWIWCFNKPTYIVQLPRSRQTPLTLYEGMAESTMQDMLDTFSEMGNLKIVRK